MRLEPLRSYSAGARHRFAELNRRLESEEVSEGRKLAEEALAEYASVLEVLFSLEDAAGNREPVARPQATVVFDSHGRILHASQSAREVLGIPAEHLKRLNISDAVHPGDLGAFLEAVMAVHDDPRWKPGLPIRIGSGAAAPLRFDIQLEWLAKTSAGDLLAAELTPVDAAAGREARWLVLGGEGEEAADSGAGAFEPARDLSPLGRDLEEFAQMIAHEVRAPLQTIQLWSESLADLGGPEDRDLRTAHLAGIRRAIGRIVDLLDDIRILGAAEGARAEPRWVPLRAVVDHVLTELRDAASERGVHCRVAEPLPTLEVDALQVQISLINLVSNAIKYRDPDKPERTVTVGARRMVPASQFCRIEVADNGLGIPRSVQEKVFTRFFRAHPGAADGTGLGLSIAEHIVRQRRGSIGFTSDEGIGSTFHVVVPCRPALAEPTATALPQPTM